MNILILAGPNNPQASTVNDSIYALPRFGQHNYSVLRVANGDIGQSISNFDGIVIHYSLISHPCKFHLPLNPKSSLQIRFFNGIKVATVQDEQRAGYERLAFLNGLGINHLFSVAPHELYEILYPSQVRNFSISELLTGYVTEEHLLRLRKSDCLGDRPFDVVYRGRKLPDWYGHLGDLKWKISDRLAQRAESNKLRVNVSYREEDRIYGQDWFEFLESGVIAVGTPSGSSFLDLFGKHNEVTNYIDPVIIDDGDPINANYTAISPKIFDYIASRNLLALTPGDYSNLIEPRKHFMELDEAADNIEEILEFSRTKSAEDMIDSAVNEILLNPRFHLREYSRQIDLIFSQFETVQGTSFRSNKAAGYDYVEAPTLPNVQEAHYNIKLFLRRTFGETFYKAFLGIYNIPRLAKRFLTTYFRNLFFLKSHMPPLIFLLSNILIIFSFKFLQDYRQIVSIAEVIPENQFTIRNSSDGHRFIGLSDSSLYEFDFFAHLKFRESLFTNNRYFFLGLLHSDTFIQADRQIHAKIPVSIKKFDLLIVYLNSYRKPLLQT